MSDQKQDIIIQHATPGAMLQKARQIKHLTQNDVATKLYLSNQCIKELESDDYKNMKARIYVRGYLCSYARLVDIPEEEVLKALDTANSPIEASLLALEEASYHPFLKKRSLPIYVQNNKRRRRPKSPSVARWFGVLVLVVLVALVILWWQGQNDHISSSVVSDRETISVETPKEKLTQPVRPRGPKPILPLTSHPASTSKLIIQPMNSLLQPSPVPSPLKTPSLNRFP